MYDNSNLSIHIELSAKLYIWSTDETGATFQFYFWDFVIDISRYYLYMCVSGLCEADNN